VNHLVYDFAGGVLAGTTAIVVFALLAEQRLRAERAPRDSLRRHVAVLCGDRVKVATCPRNLPEHVGQIGHFARLVDGSWQVRLANGECCDAIAVGRVDGPQPGRHR
jgi:hypothetical protein